MEIGRPTMLIGFSIWTVEVVLAFSSLVYLTYLLMQTKRRSVPDLLVLHMFGCELLITVLMIVDILLSFMPEGAKKVPVEPTLHILCIVMSSSLYQSVVFIVLDSALALKFTLKYKIILAEIQLRTVFWGLWLISFTAGVYSFVTPCKVEILIFWDVVSLATILCCFLSVLNTVSWPISRSKDVVFQPEISHKKFPALIGFIFICTQILPDCFLLTNYHLDGSVWFNKKKNMLVIFCLLSVLCIFTNGQKRRKSGFKEISWEAHFLFGRIL